MTCMLETIDGCRGMFRVKLSSRLMPWQWLRRVELVWIWAVMWARTGKGLMGRFTITLDECSGMYDTLIMGDSVDMKGHD